MAILVIDLQEGFSKDTVSIRVGDAEIFHETNVNTDYSIGRAASVQVDPVENPVSVTVSVPSRELTSTIAHDAGEAPHLGIYVEDEQIAYRTSQQMFEYR